MKLLDVVDRRTRSLQHLVLVAGFALIAVGVLNHSKLWVPRELGIVAAAAGLVGVIVAAGIRQRWEAAYRGHAIRFENGPLTGEHLFLDGGLVGKGGIGYRMEIRVPIRVGEGTGDEIVALSEAGLFQFRCRIYVERKDSSADASAPFASVAAGSQSPVAVQPARSQALGSLLVAKHILEFVAALIAVVGGIIAIFGLKH